MNRIEVIELRTDPSYGKLFQHRPAQGIPERKSDLVAGRYEIERSRCGTRIGVKLVDMLGEEVLVVLDTA